MRMCSDMRVGLDVGSTTLKCILLDSDGNVVFRRYLRHYSEIAERTAGLLREMLAEFPDAAESALCVSGSAGMGLAEALGLGFEQEVYATRTAVRHYLPSTDVVIELGGEDAKILFLSGAPEVRMNGSCAGGTGAFIDQVSTLLGIDAEEMNKLASRAESVPNIASRCGVFAKTDIQSLLNQGVQRESIAASIFYAVANQTDAGLAQGREISGNVLYLGGPMTFFPELRHAFDSVLGTEGHCPPDSLYFVALGAALSQNGSLTDIASAAERIASYARGGTYRECNPLFSGLADYSEFVLRHGKESVRTDANPGKRAWLGIDAGSTTVKCVAINADGEIFHSYYIANNGNPVPLIAGFLTEFYDAYPEIEVAGSYATGYGEELITRAFGVDGGVVETVAHYTAARRFDPEVDFIIDIGGQDIKCFKIKNSAIDNIFLNEACSSGCGSFLQSFAGAMGYNTHDFSMLGLFAEHPVDLGSRCTVFMNSSVKQAQKDGADVGSIAAGLCMSVVKNALYKVIRAANPDDLGEHIVVQGGAFLNDAVLRAFEMETGRLVTRPSIAGLMGAYGAALHAQERLTSSGLIRREALQSFTHKVRASRCSGCTNKCALTINSFGDGRRYIAGNRCELPVTGKTASTHFNIFQYKRDLLADFKPVPGFRGTIGLPMGLSMYEMLPFWHSFFTSLGFEVHTSPESSRELYYEGQRTIPSDTVCYPAKLVHGHVETLRKMGISTIFFPCITYNIDEGLGDNCYNCPVVAYYPEVIAANLREPDSVRLIADYVGPHRRRDFPNKMFEILARYFDGITKREIKAASDSAYAAYRQYQERIQFRAQTYLREAKALGMPVIILAGRPYHIDGEVNHGIDQLLNGLGAAVLSEDSFFEQLPKPKLGILNQWTYHARMFAAAKFIADSGDMDINLVQLVSFGCGVDAITTDELRAILEESGRIYTQVKIDEVSNLGAVKIRIRSLFAAIEQLKERSHA